MYEFDVVIIEDKIGGYIASVPALPGCHTQGDTLGELVDNVKRSHRTLPRNPDERREKNLLQQRVVGIQKVKAFA